jgi:hypothetical protein
MTLLMCAVFLARTGRARDDRDRCPERASEGCHGDGLTNSAALASKAVDPHPLGTEGGGRPSSHGLTNGTVPRVVAGLETRVDLVNGNPARDEMPRRGRPRPWGRSARRRRAERASLVERAARPLPAMTGQETTNERD